MGHKPTVGGTAEHSQFAKDITAYIDSVRKASGMSIRRVSELPNSPRGNSWWAGIFNGTNILTTNDIHVIATDLMGISPYELVSEARRLASGGLTTVRTFSVGGPTDDDYQQVATEEQQAPIRKAAKKGTPKARRAFKGDDDEGTSENGDDSGA